MSELAVGPAAPKRTLFAMNSGRWYQLPWTSTGVGKGSLRSRSITLLSCKSVPSLESRRLINRSKAQTDTSGLEAAMSKYQHTFLDARAPDFLGKEG